MRRRMLWTNLFRVPFTLFLILIFAFISPDVTYSQTKTDLKEKIKKAKTFEDIFKLEKTFKLEPTKDSYVARVNALLVSKKGDVIVNNVGRGGANVFIFNKNGKFIKEIGKKGDGPGEYQMPQSFTQDNEGNIYVLDQMKRQIDIFDKDYKFKNLLHYASNNQKIHVNSKKEIYLYMGIPLMPGSKPYKSVVKLGRDGKKTAEFAELPTEVNKMKFYAMYDCMAIDKNDIVYESNPLLPHIRKYTPEGQLISEFGEKRIKMITETDKDGKSYEYPRCMESFLIFRDVIILMFSDNKADFYDTAGNLLNKEIPVKYTIQYAGDNEVYLVESDDKLDNPILHKYVVK
jgi:hypothetical protein